MDVVVVVPAAPALVPGLAIAPPPGYADLLDRCDHALAAVVLGAPGVALVAATDPPSRDRTPVAASGRERTGWLVADHLLDRAGHRGPRRRVAASEWDGTSEPVVVVAADGSAGHGPKSPRPEVGAAGVDFDDALAAALRLGDLAALSRVTDTDAARVGCSCAAAWRALGDAAGGEHWRPVLTHHDTPYGVGAFVAVLRRGEGGVRLPHDR